MKINKIIALFAIVSLLLAPSCSDDAPAVPLESTQGENAGITHNSLSFEWDKVAGAVQYGYELYDNYESLVVRDVTGKTSLTLRNLKPATEYTLKVWAYAAIGSGYISSEPIVMTATTEALKTIGQPTLTFARKGLASVISWKKVTNADAYSYSLQNASGVTVVSGSTTSRSISFPNLELGDYTIIVKATTKKDGYESEGQAVSLDFTVVDVVVWKVEGVYTSAILGKSWKATLVYVGDDNYVIQGWYGVEGYDLLFYLDYSDEESIFNITSGVYEYSSGTGHYTVPTGRTDLSAVEVYPWWNYSTFTGNETSGAISLYVWSDNKNYYLDDTFVWNTEPIGSYADNFVGTWNVSLTGNSAINDDWTFAPFEKNSTIEILKIDDNTISMPALYFNDETMNVKINWADKTLTIQPLSDIGENGWFTLAGNASESSPIVGKINDDGSFEFTNWNAWSDGDKYLDNTIAKYSR